MYYYCCCPRIRGTGFGLLLATIVLFPLPASAQEKEQTSLGRVSDSAGGLRSTDLPVLVDPASDLTAREDRPNESWYLIAHVKAGLHRYSFLAHYLSGINISEPIATSAVSITDDNTGRYLRSEAALPERAGLSGKPGIDIRTSNLTWVGDARQMTLQARVPEGEINVTLRPEKHVLYNMGTGYFPMFGDTAYPNYEYAFPSIETTGTLMIDGNTEVIEGESWLDHQWGPMPSPMDPAPFAWTWMGMSLNDGSKVSLWKATHGTTSTWATVLRPDGSHIISQASILPVGIDTWTSPESGLSYPTRWSVALPGVRAVLSVSVTAPNQELVVPGSRLEASATVTGFSDGHHVSGSTYVEVVGANLEGR